MKPSNYSHFVEVARQRAVEHPERDCVIFLEDGENKTVGGGTSASMTYQQNDQAACQVAASLQKRGIKQGERVLVILPNSLEFVKIFYGCLYGGILAVPLSEPAGPQNMAAYLETFLPTLKVSKPSLIIVSSQLAEFLRNQLPPELQKVFSGLKSRLLRKYLLKLPQNILHRKLKLRTQHIYSSLPEAQVRRKAS